MQKKVLITGAAGAMGLELVKLFSGQNYQVVAADINDQLVKERTQDIPGDIYPVGFDLNNPDAIEKACTEIKLDLGNIDLLINNGGLLSNNKVLETSSEEWFKIININLNSAFLLSKAFIPGMKKKGWGRIVNISSVAAKSGGITAGTAYTTSKGGMISLTFSLAAELAPFGITVNGVAPAYVKTPMVTEQLTEKQQKEILKKIPVGRFCELEEFASVIQFLCNDNSGFITGEIIDLNGGIHFD